MTLPFARTFLRTILIILFVSADVIFSSKNSTEDRIKRNDYHLPQSRRLSDTKTYSASYNKLQQPFNPSHGVQRQTARLKPAYIPPPYAVKMEPLVQYSQRDPLYHDKESTYNISIDSLNVDLEKHSKADNFAEAANNYIDYSPPRYGPPSPPSQLSYDVSSSSFPHFYKEPEPIIEIIIKESNETLPTPSNIPILPPSTTVKEPIQVFYVKYKKNRTHTGKEEVVYEEPIPALTPLSTDIVENHSPSTEPYYAPVPDSSPTPPSTTYRTIIRPDSEIYHGTGLKVTFGNHEEPFSQQQSPYARVSEAQKRDSVIDQEAPPESKPTNVEREVKTPPKHVIENRQGQTDYTKYVNTRSETAVTATPHTIHQRQNHPLLTNIGPQVNSIQPLQIEDGSYEQPPAPPPYVPQTPPSPKLAYSAQSNPSRSPHNANFQPIQNNDFPSDLSLLQRQTQSQFQLLQSQQQSNHVPNKIFPRVAQPIIHQQVHYQQNQQQFPAQDIPYTSQQHSQSLQPSAPTQPQLSQLQNIPYQYNVPVGRNELQQPNKNNRYVSTPTEPNNINYNPSPPVYHPPHIPFTRNEFLQQPFSSPKLTNQQAQLYLQQQQPQQPQQQQQKQQEQLQQLQQQQQNAVERQKQLQLQYEKTRQLLQLQYQQKTTSKRPYDASPLDSSTKPETPTYHSVFSSGQLRQPIKVQNPTPESTTSSSIQDGQIFKAISQSEEHQVLQSPHTFDGARYVLQQQQYSKPAVNYVQYDTSSYKPPRQYFETDTRSQPFPSTTPHPDSNRYDELLLNKTERVTQPPPPNKTEKPASNNKQKEKTKSNLPAQLAALPDEVPDDLREQLLSSGILNNADIQILDYDKVGDIPIENLPPEALENLYGAGSAPVPSIAYANSSKAVEMKIVRYDPNSSAGQNLPQQYVQEDSTEVDPVVLNDSSYNRYLPLKVKGSQFPIPDSPLLRNKKITSVVVLAPVDYDFVQQNAERQGKSVPQVHGVRFVSGESLKALVKNPIQENFRRWIENEKKTPANKQSVILLVTNTTDQLRQEPTAKEIFMYDIPTGEVSRLEGELSAAFVNVAESNADSEDFDSLSETSHTNKMPVTRVTSVPVYGSTAAHLQSKSRAPSSQ